MALLTVGRGRDYSTIKAAVAASQDGDVLQVQAGTYTNDFATITTDITLQAVGGRVHLKATAAPPNGKAILVTRADVTIDGFEFSGTKVPDRNGAGIRQEVGDLVVRDSHFHHNQNGILTIARQPESTLTIERSEFDHNGIGDGRTHNLYVGMIGKLVVEDSYFHDVRVGHLLKSRAEETVITGSRFLDHGSSASYEIDLPNGGRVVLRDNVIQQGPNSQNPAIIAFGEEGRVHAGSSLEMTGNTVISERAGRMVWNKTDAAVEVTGTRVFGLDAEDLLSGPGTVGGTTWLPRAPALDTAAPWSGRPAPAPEPGPQPEPEPPVDPEPEPPVDPEPEPPPAGASRGTPRDDRLVGGDAKDRFEGGLGDDTLIGGGGGDVLMGGAGADVFVFGPAFGDDTLRDFRPGVDRLDIAALGVTAADFGDRVAILDYTHGAVVEIGAEGSITFHGTRLELGRDDFILG